MTLRTNKKSANAISSFIMVIVVLAFALKSVLPVGFMPVVNKDGFTEIVICSGMGEKTIKLPSDGNPSSDHKTEQEDKTCAYQVLASGKIFLSAPDFTLPAPIIRSSVLLSFDKEHLETSTFHSFTARGPPSA